MIVIVSRRISIYSIAGFSSVEWSKEPNSLYYELQSRAKRMISVQDFVHQPATRARRTSLFLQSPHELSLVSTRRYDVYEKRLHVSSGLRPPNDWTDRKYPPTLCVDHASERRIVGELYEVGKRSTLDRPASVGGKVEVDLQSGVGIRFRVRLQTANAHRYDFVRRHFWIRNR